MTTSEETVREAAEVLGTCSCCPGGFSPETYEGPQEDCPVHGKPEYRAQALAEAGLLRQEMTEQWGIREGGEIHETDASGEYFGEDAARHSAQLYGGTVVRWWETKPEEVPDGE